MTFTGTPKWGVHVRGHLADRKYEEQFTVAYFAMNGYRLFFELDTGDVFSFHQGRRLHNGSFHYQYLHHATIEHVVVGKLLERGGSVYISECSKPDYEQVRYYDGKLIVEGPIQSIECWHHWPPQIFDYSIKARTVIQKSNKDSPKLTLEEWKGLWKILKTAESRLSL